MAAIFETISPGNPLVSTFVAYYYIDLKPDNQLTEIQCFPHYHTTISLYVSHYRDEHKSAVYREGAKPLQIYTPVFKEILHVRQVGRVHRVVIVFKPLGVQQFFSDLNFAALAYKTPFFAPDELEEIFNNPDLSILAGVLDGALLRRYKSFKSPLLEGALQCIFDNFQAFSVEQTAQSLQVSRRHLNKSFQQYFGVSVKKFHQIVMFRKAIQSKLIEHPDKSFTEIAHEFYFSDQPHLNKTFQLFTKKRPAIFFQTAPIWGRKTPSGTSKIEMSHLYKFQEVCSGYLCAKQFLIPMKSFLYFFTICLFFIIARASGQVDYEKHKTLAGQHFNKGNFKEALVHYDLGYSHPNHRDNYGTFHAALAACQVGDTTKALYYLNLSSQIGYDYSSYEYFIENPLNTCLKHTKEWKQYADKFRSLADSAAAARTRLEEELSKTIHRRIDKTALTDTAYWYGLTNKLSAKQLIAKIKSFSDFPETEGSDYWVLYQHRVNDTLDAPYLVHVPKNYSPSEAYPLYVYLHGGVVNRLQFGDPFSTITGQETQLMTHPKLSDAIVLFPFGKRNFGWLYQQSAFEAILDQIAEVKSRYHINDNRVYLGGHSNGGTGAFWFANKKAYPFASFYAFNFLPVLYSANTTLKNLDRAPPFYSINGLKDRVFLYEETRRIYEYAKSHGSAWVNAYLDEGHSLPFSGNDSALVVFDQVKQHVRNPFPTELYWETDDVRNGRKNWFEITALDTTASRAGWHTDLVPEIVSEKKFQRYPFNKNKTGAVRVSVMKKNAVFIESSRVKKVRIYLSEDMFNLRKKIEVYHNGKRIFHSKVVADGETIISEFLKTYDRGFVVSKVIEIDLK